MKLFCVFLFAAAFVYNVCSDDKTPQATVEETVQVSVVEIFPEENVDTSTPAVSVKTPTPGASVGTPTPPAAVGTSTPAVAVDTSNRVATLKKPTLAIAVQTSTLTGAVDRSTPEASVKTSAPVTGVETSAPAAAIETSIPETALAKVSQDVDSERSKSDDSSENSSASSSESDSLGSTESEDVPIFQQTYFAEVAGLDRAIEALEKYVSVEDFSIGRVNNFLGDLTEELKKDKPDFLKIAPIYVEKSGSKDYDDKSLWAVEYCINCRNDLDGDRYILRTPVDRIDSLIRKLKTKNVKDFSRSINILRFCRAASDAILLRQRTHAASCAYSAIMSLVCSKTPKVSRKNSAADGTGKDSAADGTGKDSAADGTGKDSAAGVTEKDSTAGVTGKDSGAGVTGKDSAAGVTGTDSAAGVTGKDSTAGVTGKDSAAGVTGTDSAAGVTEKDSTAGVTGKDSAAGVTGKDSAAGVTGKDSTPEVAGKDFTANVTGKDSRGDVSSKDSGEDSSSKDSGEDSSSEDSSTSSSRSSSTKDLSSSDTSSNTAEDSARRTAIPKLIKMHIKSLHKYFRVFANTKYNTYSPTEVLENYSRASKVLDLLVTGNNPSGEDAIQRTKVKRKYVKKANKLRRKFSKCLKKKIRNTYHEYFVRKSCSNLELPAMSKLQTRINELVLASVVAACRVKIEGIVKDRFSTPPSKEDWEQWLTTMSPNHYDRSPEKTPS